MKEKINNIYLFILKLFYNIINDKTNTNNKFYYYFLLVLCDS